ncbi:MAG: PD40 domain-containing protein [Planctomycetes bacterium]|nr:PD40 domain-containing protein [Planctomycetota bacterium]MBI3845151.1 PD40 domain-containing protein [Planctomycetota bacterium]
MRITASWIGFSCAFASTFAIAQETTRVSVTTEGYQADNSVSEAVLSADGRYVAFTSASYSLVAGDTNRTEDVFVHDRLTHETTRVSLGPNLVQGDMSSTSPALSADGRYVAFVSRARNLVAGDTNDLEDVFVRDRLTHVTERISVSSDGLQAMSPNNVGSSRPVLSLDGRFVAFESFASNLVPNDLNIATDIFLHDRQTGVTERVSVNAVGLQLNGSSFRPAMSADGRYVTFETAARGVVVGDTGNHPDVFVRDRVAATTELVSVNSAGVQGDRDSQYGSISADGRFVSFSSVATNLDPNDQNVVDDVFVRDRIAQTTTRISTTWTHGSGNSVSFGTALSHDGRFIAFESVATNLLPGETDNTYRIFLHDRVLGVNVRLDVGSSGAGGVGVLDPSSANPFCSLSFDGRFAAFASRATDLVEGDTNNVSDAFVREHPFCSEGTVGAAHGFLSPVLHANGAIGVVRTSVGLPLAITLDSAVNGPAAPKYALWVWAQPPSSAHDLRRGGAYVGCTVNPTPLHSPASPQPILCIHGTGVPSAVCGSVASPSAPARGPWTIHRNTGFAVPTVLTMQGILEDSGAANPTGFSVTNAIVVRVE